MQRIVNPIKLALLSLLLIPIFVTAQTCNTTSISATTAHLVDNNNGTINDPKTGLVWKKCSEGQAYNSGTNSCDNSATTFNWQSALQQAQDVNAGTSGENLGQTDWRVPNMNELASIAELSCYYPAINEVMFPNTPSNWYWSSSPVAYYSSYAWMLSFAFGDDSTFVKFYGGHVRLVRSGQ